MSPVKSNDAATPPSRRRHSDEFKRDAVRLVVDEKYSFPAAAKAIGVSEHSLRKWHEKIEPKAELVGDNASVEALQAEVKRLQKALKWAELEREIRKKRDGVLRQGIDMKYAWTKEHRTEFSIVMMCGVMGVSWAGYYASLDWPQSERAQRRNRVR